MSKQKGRRIDAAMKARIALEALREEAPAADPAKRHGVHILRVETQRAVDHGAEDPLGDRPGDGHAALVGAVAKVVGIG